MMSRTFFAAVFVATYVVTPLASADALRTGPSETSATIIVHPDVLSAKKGEVASRHESGESVRLLRTYPELRLV